ncbi:MAG: VIT domain-containing protein [Myxococcota bacterium]
MAEWTDEAKQALGSYLGERARAWRRRGVGDDRDVMALRERIHAAVEARGLTTVTAADVKTVIRELDLEDALPGVGPTRSPSGLIFGGLFGVLLPAGTLVFELSTGVCAESFFDPIPTPLHVLLVALVAVGNALTLAVTTEIAAKQPWRIRLLGLTIGVSALYSLLFLPLVPVALLGMIFGLGFLPLSPHFSLLVALLNRRWVRKLVVAEGKTPRRMWPMAVGAVVLLLGLEVPGAITRWAVNVAASDDVPWNERAVRFLRAVGSEEEILRGAYVRSGRPQFLGARVESGPSVEKAREVFYRVTGEPYNARPRPSLRGIARWEERWATQSEQGGEEVGGRVRGLTLHSSRVDASVDGDAALAYLEWTLEFANSSEIPAEARAQVMLPPGAVVSRLTLWVNGEEREAAFAAKGETRAAYQAVVRTRRDPVLVTTQGPDRILVQCFPVPTHGQMRIRLGITAPLLLPAVDDALLIPPRIIERNFTIPDDVGHTLWADSRAPLRATAKGLTAVSDGKHTLRGTISDGEWLSPDAIIHVARDAASETSHAQDKRSGAHVQQVLQLVAVERPSRVVLVVDNSATMRATQGEIAQALASLPDGIEVGVIAARDAPEELLWPVQPAAKELLTAYAQRIRQLEPVGGADNVAALLRAVELLSDAPRGAIVWIHGPQPVLFGRHAALMQALDHVAGKVSIHDVRVHPGRNRVLEEVNVNVDIRNVPITGTLGTALTTLFASWKPGTQQVVAQRRQAPVAPTTGHETSAHLARLWARDEVLRLLRANNRAGALETAVRYQLVTPVSGAVVLETQQQYDDAGLTPVEPGTVPTVPEPETWLLLIVALGCVAVVSRRRGMQAA